MSRYSWTEHLTYPLRSVDQISYSLQKNGVVLESENVRLIFEAIHLQR